MINRLKSLTNNIVSTFYESRFLFLLLANMKFRYVSDIGNQFINKATGKALSAGSSINWRFDDDYGRVVDLRHERALDRGWNQNDGQPVSLYTSHDGPNQKWSVEKPAC